MSTTDPGTFSHVAAGGASSEFVISLDFELLWGVRDHMDRDRYGRNILGAREAIPRMLDTFARRRVAATWATVGLLFCESREELLDGLPPVDLRPAYANPALSNYAYLDEVGRDERADPYYFGASLIRAIAATPGQEIGTHTLSHYYCLEPGQTGHAFEADLSAALALARRRGVEIRSIVFPRNQYGASHLEICRRLGITAYRGNQQAWPYRAAPKDEETLLKRGARLLDAHLPVFGGHAYAPQEGAFRNVPASQFLRPCVGQLARVHGAHVSRIMAAMTRAAQSGRGYHLWWHPHNFGVCLEDNMAALARILDRFAVLRDTFDMRSRTMSGVVAQSA